MLFTALLQSQLVAYPATSHRLRRFLHPLPLFRDPGFLRGSSTSARRSVKSQLLATSAEVPLDVPSSLVSRPLSQLLLFPLLPPRPADAFFPWGGKLALAKNRQEQSDCKTSPEREKLLATCRTNNSASMNGHCHHSCPRSGSLLFISFSEDTVIFLFSFFQKRDRHSMSNEVYLTARRRITSVNATYKINAVALK